MMCPEKVAYSTLRGAAEAALVQLEEQGRAQRAYACDRCSEYHLTSQPLGRQGVITADMVRALARAVGSPFALLDESPFREGE